jgi:hypothetical protein
MTTPTNKRSGWKNCLSGIKANLFSCLFHKKDETGLAQQDAGLQRMEGHWKDLNSRLGRLEGDGNSETSDHNIVLVVNEVQGLHERIAVLETSLAEQKSLFQKLISDFTKLEETHWCSISSIASSHSPKSVGSDQTDQSQLSDSHPIHSDNSELSEIHNSFSNDSINSSSSDDEN